MLIFIFLGFDENVMKFLHMPPFAGGGAHKLEIGLANFAVGSVENRVSVKVLPNRRTELSAGVPRRNRVIIRTYENEKIYENQGCETRDLLVKSFYLFQSNRRLFRFFLQTVLGFQMPQHRRRSAALDLKNVAANFTFGLLTRQRLEMFPSEGPFKAGSS